MKQKKHKINGEVRFPQVRIIGETSQVMSSYEASKLAESEGKDLILIQENANPPIVKIENYKKFLYEIEQKEKANKKHSHKNEVKEIVLSPVIADHDLQIKAKKALEFLEEGNKVKCTLLLKGRQNQMSERGELVMLKFASFVEEKGIPEQLPKLEGTKWLMLIKPKVK